MSYTKLFSHIVTSTIWREPKEVKILWITMLALSNKHGEVMASIPGLADMARLTVKETEVALVILEGPDSYSRTPDHDGRRLFKIDGGWHVLNYTKHRRMASVDEQREMAAARQRRWYQKHKKPNAAITVSHEVVTANNATITHECDNAEAKADTDTEKRDSEEKGDVRGKGKVKKPSASHKGPTLTDELFMAEIKRHYPDVDVDRELHRMDAWLLTPAAKGRSRTRRFVVNWLNKCDAPMKGGSESKCMSNGFYPSGSANHRSTEKLW